METRTVKLVALAGLAVLASICSPSGEEPEAVVLAVRADSGGLQAVTNDRGWTVELAALRIAIRDFEFTIEGEMHARAPDALPITLASRALALDGLTTRLVSRALAHAGHYAGGEVTGELSGDFIVDFFAEKRLPLGEAELLPGDYNGVNLTFRTASRADGLEGDDPLRGHTAFVEGVADREGETVAFTAVVDVADDTQMVGGPFELDVTEEVSATLVYRVYILDPSENDTLFDGLDFGELDHDGDGEVAIEPGQPAHNILMKTLIRHDHHGIEVRR
jgi:hypothetical protein